MMKRFNPAWIAVGAGVGVALGAALHDLGLWIAVGTAVSVAMAQALPKTRR